MLAGAVRAYQIDKCQPSLPVTSLQPSSVAPSARKRPQASEQPKINRFFSAAPAPASGRG
jgi:hypothetical protein